MIGECEILCGCDQCCHIHAHVSHTHIYTQTQPIRISHRRRRNVRKSSYTFTTIISYISHQYNLKIANRNRKKGNLLLQLLWIKDLSILLPYMVVVISTPSSSSTTDASYNINLWFYNGKVSDGKTNERSNDDEAIAMFFETLRDLGDWWWFHCRWQRI